MSYSSNPLKAFAPTGVWSTEQILPEGFLPMLPTPAQGPLDSAGHAYEIRWEGLRVLLGLEGKRITARNSAGQDVTGWFPELPALRKAIEPEWVLLDGELVVIRDARPMGELLQRRTRGDGEVSALVAECPVTFIATDILRIGDSWLLDVNWEERREILTRAVQSCTALRISHSVADGSEALDRARALGLDSVLAKRLRGRYSPGERTRDWLSIRPLDVVEAMICGWTEGRGARASGIGSLILGQPQAGQMVYIGHTGTGLTAEALATLEKRLSAAAPSTCPFTTDPVLPGAPRWVEPELRCRVRYNGWSGGKLRSAAFLELVEGEACSSPDGTRRVGAVERR